MCNCTPATFDSPAEFCDECTARYEQEQADDQFVSREMEACK